MTGWWLSFTPLKKYEFVRLDHHRNSWGKYKIHVPNQQPDRISLGFEPRTWFKI